MTVDPSQLRHCIFTLNDTFKQTSQLCPCNLPALERSSTPSLSHKSLQHRQNHLQPGLSVHSISLQDKHDGKQRTASCSTERSYCRQSCPGNHHQQHGRNGITPLSCGCCAPTTHQTRRRLHNLPREARRSYRVTMQSYILSPMHHELVVWPGHNMSILRGHLAPGDLRPVEWRPEIIQPGSVAPPVDNPDMEDLQRAQAFARFFLQARSGAVRNESNGGGQDEQQTVQRESMEPTEQPPTEQPLTEQSPTQQPPTQQPPTQQPPTQQQAI